MVTHTRRMFSACSQRDFRAEQRVLQVIGGSKPLGGSSRIVNCSSNKKDDTIIETSDSREGTNTKTEKPRTAATAKLARKYVVRALWALHLEV